MPRKSQSAKTVRRLSVATRQAEVMKLRVSGHSIREVAAKLKVSVGTVHSDIEAALKAVPAEGVAELRQVRGEQLEAVIRGNLPKARRGNHENAGAVIRAVAEYSKLFGLNAKVEVDLSASLTLGADAHAQLLDRLSRVAPDEGEDDDCPEPQPG